MRDGRQTTAGADRPRPLRADAERNRLRILEAAAEVFAERGLGAGMDQIADRAGVGVGTVYRRFPDKDELIDAIFVERVAELVALAEDSAAMEDPWEGLIHFLEGGSELQGRNLAIRELMFGTGRGREWVAVSRSRLAPIVGRLVERAQDSGKLRNDLGVLDIPLIELMLASVIRYSGDTVPDIWRRMLTVVVDGLTVSRDRPTPLPEEPLRPEQIASAIDDADGLGGPRLK